MNSIKHNYISHSETYPILTTH